MTTKTVELTNTMRRLGNEYRAFFGHTWKYDGAEIVYVKGYFQIRKNGETLATSNHADVLHNHMVAYARNGTPNMAMLRAGIARSTPVKKKPLEKPEQPLLNGASEVTSMVAPELETPIAAIEVSVAATSPFADGTFGKRYADKVYHYTKDGQVTLCGLKAWGMEKKPDTTGLAQIIECEKCRTARKAFMCDKKEGAYERVPLTDGAIYRALKGAGFKVKAVDILTTTRKEGVTGARVSVYADMPTITVASTRQVLLKKAGKATEGLGETVYCQFYGTDRDSENGSGILIMNVFQGMRDEDLIDAPSLVGTDAQPLPSASSILDASDPHISSGKESPTSMEVWTIKDQHEIGNALKRYGHSMGVDKNNQRRFVVGVLDVGDAGAIEAILSSLHTGEWQVMREGEKVFHLHKVIGDAELDVAQAPRAKNTRPKLTRDEEHIRDVVPRTDKRYGKEQGVRGRQSAPKLKQDIMVCAECGKPFSAKRKDAKTCGATCRKRYQRRKDELQKDYNTVMNALTRLSMLGRKYPDLYTAIRESLITFGSEVRAIQADLHNSNSGAEG